MATKYSSVNFSVPEGADPLGIGIPDLGQSSYDPLDTIRRGWEQSRQDRMQKQAADQEAYQKYKENMPTAEGVNQQIAKTLNEKMTKMGALFMQQQKAGAFGGFSKDNEGQKVSAQLSQLENEIATEMPIYSHYVDQYKQDMETISSGANKDKIDWELTNKNVEDATKNTSTVEGFAQPFANNGGSLVVWKPEEADLMGFVKNAVTTYYPGTESYTLFDESDPTKLKTTQIDEKDQKKLYDSIIKGYETAPQAIKNEINRRYNSASASTKKDANGVLMDPAAWFATQYAPDYGRSSKTTIADTTETKKTTGVASVGRTATGELDLESLEDAMVINTPFSATTSKFKKTTWGGKTKYEEPVTEAQREESNYNVISVPLSGFNKAFEMYVSGDAINTDTGERPPQGKSAVHTPVAVNLLPTWKGDPIDYTVEDVNENGDKIQRTYTINPGDLISKEVEEQLQSDKITSFSYEPYLMTSSVYGAALTDKAMPGGISWEEYVSRNGKTMLVPWNSAKRTLFAKMEAEGVDREELETLINEIYNKKNSVDSIFNR